MTCDRHAGNSLESGLSGESGNDAMCSRGPSHEQTQKEGEDRKRGIMIDALAPSHFLFSYRLLKYTSLYDSESIRT